MLLVQHSVIWVTRKYYPSSKQFRDPPTYTHQPSMQQKVPFSLIRCSSSKVDFCSCVEWGWHIYNIVESESDPLTRRAVDLFEKEPLKGNSEVHLHTPTKFGEDRSKDLGGDREQTDRQTNRQTDKRCSIYSMITKRYIWTAMSCKCVWNTHFLLLTHFPAADVCTDFPSVYFRSSPIWGLSPVDKYISIKVKMQLVKSSYCNLIKFKFKEIFTFLLLFNYLDSLPKLYIYVYQLKNM